MVGNATGLNPDGLSLDLQFAADKTLTARKGPTPVFSRGSSGTFVNTNGLIVGKTTATTTSSLTPNSIPIGQQIFVIVPSGSVAGWVVGQPISLIVDTDGQDDPDATELWLLGNITSIAAGTLTFEVTSRTAQAGSASSWTLGYRGPRFDHDPVTLACKGLLIEESRTNLTTQSGNPASWTGGFTNNGATTAPDGLSNGVAALVGILTITTPATGAITGLHAASVFVKRNNTDWVRIQAAQGSFAHAVNFWVNLATGAAGTLSVAVGTPTSLSAQVTPFGNSWYRISITASYPATALLTLSVISATADASVTRVAGSIYEVWGAQVEAGSFPTSYIPTTIAAAARSADVCSITGSAFTGMYNATEGTLISGGSIASLAGSNRGMWGINNNTGSHGFLTYYDASLVGVGTQSRNTTATTLLPTFANSANTSFNRGLAYYTGGGSISTNGASVTNTAAVISTQTMLTLQIGNMLGGSFYWSGHISSIRYYKKRLSDARLIMATDPNANIYSFNGDVYTDSSSNLYTY
jgi:hypothetical protein